VTVRLSPAVLLTVAALGIASSSVVLDVSGASPSTATFLRCALAVPLLAPLAVRERRRRGGRLTRRQVAHAALAGAFFAGRR
jgi:drug/metabolite transporter (DMT)-like permease